MVKRRPGDRRALVFAGTEESTTPDGYQWLGVQFGAVPYHVEGPRGAPAREHMMTNKKLPAPVQGRLITTLDLDGAGSNDRGIDISFG